MCSYTEVNNKFKQDSVALNDDIRKVYEYLLSLDPVETTEKTLSASSFENLNDPVLTKNPDGTYNVSVTTTVDVSIKDGDSLTVKAQINANATMATQIPNQAAVKYINSADEVLEKESDKPYVYTGAINLLKVDSEDNSKLLPNAVFEVYRTATADEVGAEIEGLTELPGLVGKFVKVSFFDNSALTGEKVTTVKSDENGKVAIYGLAYGTYYLRETDAPAGYNKLGNTVELTINDLSHTDEKAIVIENESGIVLPETGGIGTTIFTVLGFSFIVLAGVLLICKRRTN